MVYEDILYGVARITINRLKVMNASLSMCYAGEVFGDDVHASNEKHKPDFRKHRK